MAEGTVKKNKKADTGKYSYKYVDIAQVHEYLEEIGVRYYQYVERIDGDDYIVTVPIIEGREMAPRRGCKVVDATLVGTSNPAQQQGSAITYARRYSLLMAFGLATEDDDAQSLSKPKEKANAKPKQEVIPPWVEPSTTEQIAEKISASTITPEEAFNLEQLIVSYPANDTPEERIRKISNYYGVKSLYDLTVEQAAQLRKKLGGVA